MAIDEAYEAVSGARRPSDDELAEAGIAREPAYLRAGRRSKEFRELADDLKARGRTDHQRVLEVRDFLGSEGNFAYSLEFLPTPDVDPIEDFLFTQREGHCAYFASAMVLLLRQMGIPARLATGFAEGEYVPAIKAYVVRQADAHAWVEVPYNGHGWVAFDPTPIDYGWRDPRNRLGTAPLSERRGRALVGRMASAWGNWVVRYDRGKQRRLYSGLATLIGESLAWGRSRASSVATPWVGWGGAALLLGGGIIGAAWSLRRKERERLRELGASGLSRPQRSVIGFYHRMLEMLARCGVRRRRSETATEFAGRATRGGDAPKEPMVALTFAFERVRYGRLPLSESEADEADRALAELGRSLETADARGSAPP